MYKFWFIIGYFLSFAYVEFAYYFEGAHTEFWKGIALLTFCAIGILVIFNRKK